jgi:uncharacterized protein YndB with AHSA1/START domain
VIKINLSVVIHRPVEEVFAYSNDISHWAEWNPGLIEASASEGPLQAGTRIREVFKFLGRRIESTFELVEYAPNRKVTYRTVAGPIPMTGTQTYEPVDGGTKLTVSGEGEAGGFFKLAEPVVAGMTRRQFQTGLENLKDLLEARVPASSGGGSQ